MKIISTWTVRHGALKEAVERFLATQGKPAEGVTLLGRWHKTDCSGGFSLFESDDPKALYESTAVWADLLEIENSLVIEDADAGPLLAKVFAK